MNVNQKRTDMSHSISSMYVRLADNMCLHMFPSHGLLINEKGDYVERLDRETSAILAQCDGSSTIGNLISHLGSTGGDDTEIYLALIKLADLANRQFLNLTVQPTKVRPRVLGDSGIYYPRHIQVELTTSCNLRCSFCYRNAHSPGRDVRLTTDELLGILQNLQYHGLQSLELTGGEPLIHRDFMQILFFCAERFTIVGVLTNGTLLTEQLVTQMKPLRNKMAVGISLDGPIAEIHDQRRGQKGAFDRTTKAIKLLADAGFVTRVSMVFDENTWDYVEPTLLLARSLGASSFGYSPVLPLGRGKNNFRTWSKDGKQVLEEEKKLRAKYRGFIDLLPEKSTISNKTRGGCGAGHQTFALDPTGHIRPCVSFDEKMAIYGSLTQTDAHIVFGGTLASAFANLKAPQPDICGQCKYSWFCVDCPLRGLTGMEWIGRENCNWFKQPNTARWYELVNQHTKVS